MYMRILLLVASLALSIFAAPLSVTESTLESATEVASAAMNKRNSVIEAIPRSLPIDSISVDMSENTIEETGELASLEEVVAVDSSSKDKRGRVGKGGSYKRGRVGKGGSYKRGRVGKGGSYKRGRVGKGGSY